MKGRVAVLFVSALGAFPLTAASVRAQETPDPRAHHQVVYHAGEGRVYLLGGSTRRGEGYHYFDDLWAWTGEAWTRAGSLPFPRSSHRVIYDRSRNALVLFGGGSGRAFATDDTLWEWRAGRWSKLADALNAGRAEPGMCYDRERQRIVLFGGWDRSNRLSRTTREWTGDALVQMDATGPTARAGHAFLYVPARRRCWLFGGRSEDGYLSDTWEWDGTAWHRLDVVGPSPRWFFGAASDEARGRVVIFGGSGPDGDLGDTWSWDGTDWALVARDGPSPRGMAKLASDGSGLLLFGGRARTREGFQDQNDTWQLLDRSWTRKR